MTADRIRLSVLADGPKPERIRLSALADELGTDFPGLFAKLCHVCPNVIDDDLTVPASLADLVRQHSEGNRR